VPKIGSRRSILFSNFFRAISVRRQGGTSGLGGLFSRGGSDGEGGPKTSLRRQQLSTERKGIRGGVTTLDEFSIPETFLDGTAERYLRPGLATQRCGGDLE